MIKRMLSRSKSFIITPPKFSFSKISPQRFDTIKHHTLQTEYQNLNPKLSGHSKNKWQIFEDEINIKFLVQNGGFPGCSDLGILFKAGTQNENQTNAGSLSALQNLVHIKPEFTDSIKNYQFLQQTGASLNFNYDVQHCYLGCSFFQEDSDQMIDLLLDLALRKKNLFEEELQTNGQIFDINEQVRYAAFSGKGIGMPKTGLGNILTNKSFLDFQEKHITPHGAIISLSNFPDPQAAIALIKKKITQRYSEFLKRNPPQGPVSQYKGGVHKLQQPDHLFKFGVAFPGCSSRSPKMQLYNILRVLMGSASSFSSGGPGKGMHSRCTQYLLNKQPSIESASYLLSHYDDTGLFGLVSSGSPQLAEQVVDVTIRQLSNLVNPISSEQLQRAKNILIASIYANIQRQSDRLEELTRQVHCYGKIKIDQFEKNIRSVTPSEVRAEMRAMFQRQPVFVLSGDKDCLKYPVERLYQNLFRYVV